MNTWHVLMTIDRSISNIVTCSVQHTYLEVNFDWFTKNPSIGSELYASRFVSNLEVVENSINSWYSLIVSCISFNLIEGFRYPQLKPDALLHRLVAGHL